MRPLLIAYLLVAPAGPALPDAGVFEAYLRNEIPAADGFDFPVGDPDGRGSYTDPATGKNHRGWYVALGFCRMFTLGIHPGEDFNGGGGGNTDAGQPVCAVAAGRVVYAEQAGKPWGRVVMIEHVFYENHHKKTIRSLYAHLGEVRVKKGQVVTRRQVIGTIGRDPQKLYKAHLHLELRWNLEIPAIYWPSAADRDRAWIEKNYEAPTRFIRSHRRLFVPQKEQTLVLVDQASYRMQLYRQGQLAASYDVSFGQRKGRKQRRGDLKTPKGMYFVIKKKKGRFGGDYGAYYGGHWIKINYPNAFDAVRGVRRGWIDARTRIAIRKAWARRRPTDGTTRLGGGIGFHGWSEEWDNDGPRHLSWGCVVLHLRDIADFYQRVSAGTMVVIF